MLKTLDVVCAILEQDGKILLAQRPLHADQPGLWEFAGGKVEAGETQPDALVRELREELGIEARPTRYIASQQREVSQRLITLHAWHVPAFTGTPETHYHSQLAWCSPRDAELRSCPGGYPPAGGVYSLTRRQTSGLVLMAF